MRAGRGRVNRPKPSTRGNGRRKGTAEGIVEDVLDNAIVLDGTEYRVKSANACDDRSGCVCADHLEWPEIGDEVRIEYTQSSQGMLFVDGVEILEAEAPAPATPRAPAAPIAEEPQRFRGPDPVIELHRLRGTALTAAARLAEDGDSLEKVVVAAGRLLSWIQSGVLPPPFPVATTDVAPAAAPAAAPANGHSIESHRGTVETVSAYGFRCKGAERWFNYAANYAGMRAAEGERISFDLDGGRVIAVREYSG